LVYAAKSYTVRAIILSNYVIITCTSIWRREYVFQYHVETYLKCNSVSHANLFLTARLTLRASWLNMSACLDLSLDRGRKVTWRASKMARGARVQYAFSTVSICIMLLRLWNFILLEPYFKGHGWHIYLRYTFYSMT